MNGHVGQHTVGYRANEKSRKKFLLRKVQPGWNLWGIWMIGPRRF